MRYLLLLLWIAPAFAQQPPAAPPKPEEQKPAAEQQTAAPAQAAEQTPAPSAEQWITGSLDFGYRWLTDIRGSVDQYRSVVNLGEGPKLFGVDFVIQDPKKRLFDRIDVQAYNWGDDPYSTAHLNARKLGVYELRADYRNIAYFDAVPSFANPFAPGGFDQRKYDIRRRMGSVSLDLRPGKRITPYLAYEHNSGYGNGIETWVQDANNQYAVPVSLYDGTNNYRGGVHFEFNRFHLTLEQGGTTFRNDDQAYWSGINYGDRTTGPLLGQTMTMTGLAQALGVRGSSIYEKGLFTGRPASWLDVNAQFIYSQPKTDASYTDLAYGQFANVQTLLLYSGQSNLGTGAANQPHSTANAGFELRPFNRLRIVESWMTDRFHNAASSLVTTQLLLGGAGPNQTNLNSLVYGQFVNYNQQQTDVLFDLTSKITLRGGYRYVWGDATVLAGELSQAGNMVSGQLKRNVGIAGMDVRPSQKLNFHLDYEGASSDRVYFRTSLNDYHRGRARVRYQATGSLMLQANFSILNNENPASDILFDFRSRTNSLSLFWTPGGGKRVTVTAEYDRSTVSSDIRYLGLFLAPSTSTYDERAHTATSAADINLPGLSGAKLTLGGSLFISSGSRPTRYYEPLARLSLPFHKNVYWNTEWRWYGFNEQFYFYEPFRTHLFQTGLRLTK